MRLFVAVWPSLEASQHLDTAVVPLRATLPDLRWQPTDRWHLTLVFLGEVAEPRVPTVTDVVGEVAGRHPAADGLAIAGSGTFGRVVWVGLRPQPSPLQPVARDLGRSLRARGFDVERRPWRAHLTLARARSDTPDVRRLRDALADYVGPTWPARELALVRSTTGPHPEYEVLARSPLSG